MSFKVKSLYEYASGHDDDLPFGIGQIITVTEEVDDDWYSGEYVDDAGATQEGMFPRNFVEKYEPVAPPRPARTRPKKEPELAPEELPAPAEEPAPSVARDEVKPVSSPPQRAAEPVAPTSPSAPKATEPTLASSPPRVPADPVAHHSPQKEAPVKRGPPPVTEKPATVSNSFKDRIAAFNKSSAPPIAPFKPSGLGGAGGSSSFIKKPFVAPPPKGNTYVPTQRNAPVAPVYRREEDPEIKEREAENTESAQKAGLLPTETDEADQDAPKPMSLKERMALLQRQQQEQAARHAEAAAKKEKPKRPATKPRMLSQESAVETAEEDAAAPATHLERRDTGETSGKPSLDEPRPPRVHAQPRRKQSTDPEPRDGNEADMSGAGETTDNQEEELTEREDSDEKPRRPSRGSLAASGLPAAAKDEEAQVDDEDEEEEEEEEDEETQEFRRKEELRARMARLGGGMGMPGMFGMPMPGAGAPALPPKKKKASGSAEKPRTSEDSQSVTSPRAAPPVPTMMALPGLGRPKQAEEAPTAEEEEEDEQPTPLSPPNGKNHRDLHLNIQPGANHFPAPAAAVGGAPPIPGGRPAPPPIPAECMYDSFILAKKYKLTKCSTASAPTSCTRKSRL